MEALVSQIFSVGSALLAVYFCADGVVFFHELGHFVARRCGVAVEVFSSVGRLWQAGMTSRQRGKSDGCPRRLCEISGR